MGKKKQLRVFDLAKEAGLTELEAIERLKRNGMEAYEGYRIAKRDLDRVRDIFAHEDSSVAIPKEGMAEGRTSAENPIGIYDVVVAWHNENQEPRHIRVAGRTYEDFVRTCYRFLLVYALRHGAPSTGIMVGLEDQNRIKAFLDRAKALWNKRRLDECEEAATLREAEEQRSADKRRRIEELHKSEIQRQARLLERDKRRLEEALRKDEALRMAKERRKAEALRQKEAQLKAELAGKQNEQDRVRRIYSRHRQAVIGEGYRLQAGQRTEKDYYSFVLRDRIRRSAEVLFGSAQNPSYELLQRDSTLLEKLKSNLSFGDDQHPADYQNKYVNAYYTLRYELGYAFEYSQIYELLLGIMRINKEDPLLDVLSIGSGQGIDYWGLRYALSKQQGIAPKIWWHGVDLEKWPDHILDDGLACYSDDTNVRDLLDGMQSLEAKVLMFPKVISELPSDLISFIAAWLERVTFTRSVHYLCFAHTERRSLDPSDSKHRGPKDRFLGQTESTLDAVKSATLVQSACDGARRQSYGLDCQWYDPSRMLVYSYDVVWPGGQAGRNWLGTYQYLIYGDKEDRTGNWHVWRDDPTFKISNGLWNAVKGIGASCCSKYMPSQSRDYASGSTDCDTYRVGCNNSYRCPLHRYPRVKTGCIAYQVVRLVKQPNYDDDIPF